jgi:cell division septation protein DedD
MALAALSFVLGFFVLARIMPGSTKPAMASTLPAGPASQADDAREPAEVPVKLKSQPADGPAEAPAKQVAGPSLDPVNDPPAASAPSGVQKPRKMQDDTAAAVDDAGSLAPDAASTQPAPRVASTRPRRRRHAAVPKVEAPAPADAPAADETAATSDDANATDREDAPVAKTRRPRRLSTPSRDDQGSAGDEGDGEQPPKIHRPDSATAGGALYHVRLGSFHSRAAADNEVERARSKGFETQVVPVMHNGRTIYRVQAGAFRERTRAESIKQSLQDASLDASVTAQGR